MRRRTKGFTLIEVIGVLTIISITAALTVPPIIRQIRQAQATGEDAQLKKVGESILAAIQATGRIPNPNVAATNPVGWFGVAYPYSSMSSNAFLCVFPENPYTERRYYLDSAFDLYLVNNAPLYQVPAGGFPTNSFPVGAIRILLVSSSRGIMNPPTEMDPVLPGTAGVNLSAQDQKSLANWNKVFTGGVVTVPTLSGAPFSANWAGLGEFLHIQCLDLRPFFCLVELRDTASPLTVSPVSLGTGYTNIPAPTNLFGTLINHGFNSLSNATISSYFPPSSISISNLPRGTNLENLIRYPVAGGNGDATNSIDAPGAPQFELMGGPVTVGYQNTNFFVLKGTSLKLISPANNSTNSQIIQKDSQFEYYGGNWRQLY